MATGAVVTFTSLIGCSKEDLLLMTDEYKGMTSVDLLTERALGMLTAQKGLYGGAQVDLYEHGLQTATRAFRDGCDEETVVIALLHDIGEVLSPSNHGEISASILRPYISPKSWWILAHHEVFQGFYYLQHMDLDPSVRDVYKDSPYFKATIHFCENYDAPSFDPNYKSMTLEEFRPMVHRIFSRTPYFFEPNHPKAGTVTGKD